MHIALICPEVAGHLNPTATLGRELARRGHRVSLVSRSIVKPRADACGFELIPIDAGEPEFRGFQPGLQKLARLKGHGGVRHTTRLLRDRAAQARGGLPPPAMPLQTRELLE